MVDEKSLQRNYLEMSARAAIAEAQRNAADERISKLEAALKPFADAARQFQFAIGPDGIDDALTIEARVTCAHERYAMLNTGNFSAARTALETP